MQEEVYKTNTVENKRIGSKKCEDTEKEREIGYKRTHTYTNSQTQQAHAYTLKYTDTDKHKVGGNEYSYVYFFKFIIFPNNE